MRRLDLIFVIVVRHYGFTRAYMEVEASSRFVHVLWAVWSLAGLYSDSLQTGPDSLAARDSADPGFLFIYALLIKPLNPTGNAVPTGLK